MSVSIGAQGTQNYVQLNHGGKTVQIPVEDKAQAKLAAKELKKVEAEMVKQEKKLGKTPEQYMTYLEEMAPKPQGVGEKLDKKA